MQIREGFIVDEDEEIEDREQRRRERKKRRRAEREREDEGLDEEDLYLIGENNPDFEPPVTQEVCASRDSAESGTAFFFTDTLLFFRVSSPSSSA
jgi:transcription elongation factor SPT6